MEKKSALGQFFLHFLFPNLSEQLAVKMARTQMSENLFARCQPNISPRIKYNYLKP